MAFDLDGTLVFKRAIEAANIDAIRRWQEAGNLAVCSTGKSIFATRVALADYDLQFDYNVLYTGAVITDGAGKILHQSSLPTSLVGQVVDHLAGLEQVAVFQRRSMMTISCWTPLVRCPTSSRLLAHLILTSLINMSLWASLFGHL